MTDNLDTTYKQQEHETEKHIVKTWLAGKCSTTLVLPKDFAKEYGLDQPSHVIIEKKDKGLFIRKLEI